jgi:hypothetical protein
MYTLGKILTEYEPTCFENYTSKSSILSVYWRKSNSVIMTIQETIYKVKILTWIKYGTLFL